MDPVNEDFIDNIITNLKILSMININDKLNVRNGHLQIEKDSILQFFKRWINKDSREITIIFIKVLIKNLNILVSSLINKNKFSKEDSLFILTRILNETDNVEKGLKNLKVTYSDDPVIVVTLENILLKLKEITQTSIKPMLISDL